MSQRGFFYAITDEEAQALLSLVGNPPALVPAVQDLYTIERQRAHFLRGVDKSWEAMHRCLSDGTLNDIGKGTGPLSWCVLGGKCLYNGKDYIVCFVTAQQVAQVAEAVDQIDVAGFVSRYRLLENLGYGAAYGDEDLQYTWDYFTNVRNLYNRAAAHGRAMVFLADR